MSITRLASAACVCAILLTGCSAPKKVPYLVDAETIPRESLAAVSTVKDPIFVQGDLLNICIYASDPTAVAQFNKGQYLTPEGAISKTSNNTNTAGTNTTSLTDYYLVDADGNIDYPVIGRIHIAGKTKEQLAREIKDAIYPRYIKIEPTIDIRLMNFRVTILGQVKSPGVYQSDNERMNILEALAKAGDLDIRGDRENVLLYRTNADGTREVHRLNLHDKSLLLSPYFNLQQNDFIYITPNRSAAASAWQMHQGWTTAISVVSGLASIAALVIGIINLNK
jgi:polysaccharide export outer membrane protein